MRTHGHREGSTTHWGLLEGIGEGPRRGSWGGIALGEIPYVDGMMDAANHHGTYIPMVYTYVTNLHILLHMYPRT